jgi:hypothetical protein
MADLTNLVRKIDRALQLHRGLRLSADEMDLLVLTGAYANLNAAALKHREEECRKLQTQRAPKLVA